MAADEEVVLSVEGLTKLHTDAHDVRYTPTMSIFWRLRDRGSGLVITGSDAGGADIDSDDVDDDEEEEADELVDRPDAMLGDAILQDVTFQVRRGEVVALVGRDETPLELAKVLSGMVAPTGGRVVIVGRLAPGQELLGNLARREPHPRRAARALASITGVPRRRRREYVQELLSRVVDDDAGKGPKGRTNPLVKRVAFAAQFDPWADVLVVDRWPSPRSFGDQFLDSVRAAQDRGAAVLIVNPYPFVAELCSRAIWLEHGKLVRDGQAADVLAELRHAIDEERRRQAHVVHGVDPYLSIQAVETQHAGRRVHTVEMADDLDVVVHFETTATLESLVCTVSFRGGRGTLDFRQDEPVQMVGAGRHAVRLNLPAGSMLAGDYAVDAAFTADHGDGTSRVAWPQAARLRVGGVELADDALALEMGMPGMPADVDPSWDFLEAVEA